MVTMTHRYQMLAKAVDCGPRCPAIFEGPDGSIVVVGKKTAPVDELNVGSGEAAVSIPREVLEQVAKTLPR